MINVDRVLKIHEILIKNFGGSNGLRDKNLLESALNRSYQTFDNKELYPTTEEKAAAIIESMVRNHPFVDGNKRIRYALMRLILLENKGDLSVDNKEKYELVINIASGKFQYNDILEWIQKNLII